MLFFLHLFKDDLDVEKITVYRDLTSKKSSEFKSKESNNYIIRIKIILYFCVILLTSENHFKIFLICKYHNLQHIEAYYLQMFQFIELQRRAI